MHKKDTQGKLKQWNVATGAQASEEALCSDSPKVFPGYLQEQEDPQDRGDRPFFQTQLQDLGESLMGLTGLGPARQGWVGTQVGAVTAFGACSCPPGA